MAAAALAAVWRSVVSVKLEDDVNEIFFCSDRCYTVYFDLCCTAVQ